MPLNAMYQKVRTSTVSAYWRQHHYIYHHCQLGHVIPGHAILLAVCIFMLPMLEAAAEHALLTTTHHTNRADLRGGHVTFSHSPLVLPSLNNVLPAMVLQNIEVKPSIHLSHSLYHFRSGCISYGLGISVSSSLQMMVVVFLLLLLSGDIETNPGPVGKHIAIVLVNLINKNKRWEWG